MSFRDLRQFFRDLTDYQFLSSLSNIDTYEKNLFMKPYYWNQLMAGFSSICRRSSKSALALRVKETLLWRLKLVKHRSFVSFFFEYINVSVRRFITKLNRYLQHYGVQPLKHTPRPQQFHEYTENSSEQDQDLDNVEAMDNIETNLSDEEDTHEQPPPIFIPTSNNPYQADSDEDTYQETDQSRKRRAVRFSHGYQHDEDNYAESSDTRSREHSAPIYDDDYLRRLNAQQAANYTASPPG